MVSGHLGGALDRVLVLLMDTLYTLPVLLLSVVLAFLLGKDSQRGGGVVCGVHPRIFRAQSGNQTAQVKSELFVEAALFLWVLDRFGSRAATCSAM